MKSFKLTLFTLFSVVLVLSSCSQAKYGSMTRRVKHKSDHIAKTEKHEISKDVSTTAPEIQAADEPEIIALADLDLESSSTETSSDVLVVAEKEVRASTYASKDNAELERILIQSEKKLAKRPVAKAVYKKVKKKAAKDAGSDLGSLLILILVIILILALIDLLLGFLPAFVSVVLWAVVLVLLILWLLNYV